MKKFRLKEKDDKIPMGALSDIVFLLLIFFLITTTIDAEKGISLVLPSTEKKPVKEGIISHILINSSGKILVDKELVHLRNLKMVIKEKLYTKPKLIASVLTARNTSYDVYIKVLDKLKQAWGNQPARISIAEPVEN